MWWRFLVPVCLGMFSGTTALSETAAFTDRFKGIDRNWHVAEYDFDHDKFDTDWRRAHVTTGFMEDGSGLNLRLAPHQGGLNRFAGGSIRREKVSHYGLYEVRMRAASHPGVVTGFFTYTGPHYGTRHDEIDIEILGRNTRQIHVAWFVDGRLQNRFIDLGFDAAEETATYAFIWCPGQIRWFVNGQEIFARRRDRGPIPEVPGRLFVNLWAADPSISNWAGTIEPGTTAQAHVEQVRFIPEPFRTLTAQDSVTPERSVPGICAHDPVS